MDLITSVFTIYGNVRETERQYRNVAGKLRYELKKANHLLQTDKAKTIPKFIIENLVQKINAAQGHLEKIESVLVQDSIPFKEKIKLSLPFNDSKQIVKNTLEQLQKAQQDFMGCEANKNQPDNNGKRFIDSQKYSKKQQTMVSLIPNEQINDEDIDEALMGPTIEEDAAIQFTRKRYILLRIELCAQQYIIKAIKEVNQDFLVFSKKIQINFDHTEKKDTQQLELFALGRVYFKPVYSKLKSVYEEIDRISKLSHFVVKVQRKRENVKFHPHRKTQQKKHPQHQNNQKASQSQCDEFFSFPCTQQQMVMKQTDTIMIERNIGKNIYILDETGSWGKMNETERNICNGQQVAPFISPNKKPQIPDLYFKVHYEFLQ